MEDRKLLTVILITYNHLPYFRKSLESVLSQKTNFGFDIHIHDDNSDDGTSELVREYQERYPNKIFATIHKKNIGVVNNIFNALYNIKTKYFATLETDDYWCDNTKLQQQIEALELNQDCSFCGHNTKTYDVKTQLMNKDGFFNKSTGKIILNRNFTLKDFIKVHPSSRVFRTSAIDFKTLKNKEIICWDSTAWWYFLSKGNLYYIDKIMSVYNYTYTGIFTGSNYKKQNQMAIKNILSINKELDYKYNKIFLKLLSKRAKIPYLKYIYAKYCRSQDSLDKIYTSILNNELNKNE